METAKRISGPDSKMYRVDVELRADPEAKIVRGYAAVYNQRSVDMWGGYEVIAAGAFGDSLRSAEHDILGLWAHDPAQPLASRDGGSLVLSEDKRGVAVEMNLGTVDIQWVRSAYEAIRTKLVTKMSIGFSILDDVWHVEDKKSVRTIRRGELYEVSPVTFPAYPGTEVSARDFKLAQEEFLARTGAASDGGSAISIDLLLAINKHKQRGAR